MKILPYMILMSMLFFSSPGIAAELSIITPLDSSLISSEQVILVIERPDLALDMISVDVNQQNRFKRPISGSSQFLCFAELTLDKGVNRITVAALRNGQMVATGEVLVHVQELRSGREMGGFQRADFHKRRSEKLCSVCHSLGTDPPEQTACFSCHGVKNAGSFVHEPTVTSCLTCHNPAIPLGTQTERQLCGQCHMLSLEEWAGKRYEHGPFALGLCTACHDPHASGQRHMLREDPTELCLACHDEVADRPHVLTTFSGSGHPIGRMPNPYRHGEQFSCSSCHNPHAGNSTTFIDQYVDGRRMQFCTSCHKLR